MTNDKNRTKILQRISNLRARAADDAASEAEVMACAAKAERLMDAYRVSEADLAIAEAEGRITMEIVSEKASLANGSQRHKAQLCWGAVEKLTNTKGVRWSHNNEVEFTGDKPDVAYAMYLFDLIKVGMDQAYTNYRRVCGGRVGRNAKANFQIEMGNAVSKRLYQMARDAARERSKVKARAEALSDEARSTSTALVMADAFDERSKETLKEYNRKHPNVRKGPSWSNSGARNLSAGSAGRRAGDSLSLGRGVGGGSSLRLG